MQRLGVPLIPFLFSDFGIYGSNSVPNFYSAGAVRIHNNLTKPELLAFFKKKFLMRQRKLKLGCTRSIEYCTTNKLDSLKFITSGMNVNHENKVTINLGWTF